MGDFDGRVALVTGAGSAEGIGSATARLVGRRGASVAVTATGEWIHERADELAAEGIPAAGFVADLMDASAVGRFVDEMIESFGRGEVPVNNAGMKQSGGQ